MSSELQLPTASIRYGFSTYLIVIAAIIGLLSMSLILWRTVSAKLLWMLNFLYTMYL